MNHLAGKDSDELVTVLTLTITGYRAAYLDVCAVK